MQAIEHMEGCYDVCDTSTTPNGLTLHDGKLSRNGRLLHTTHRNYVFDKVFDEHCSNNHVCIDVVEPMIQWIMQGMNSTLLCFGQTGTGKTYTLNGALDYISHRLVNTKIEILFFEIHGKKCYDLLENRKELRLLSDENDNTLARGAREITIEAADASQSAIMDVISAALKLRKHEVTERNPISSRSHAVCTIRVLTKTSTWGRITLVDLAGSERNYETKSMTAFQHRESADINMSLMTLKDCFRIYHEAMATNINTNTNTNINTNINTNTRVATPRIPYRASLLTRVLKECFTSGAAHRTAIIATVSPSPVDVQHSINTLDHVVLMSAELQPLTSSVTVEVPKSGIALSHIPVEQWTQEQVRHWLATADGGRFVNLALPEDIDGRGLMELDAVSLTDLFARELRSARRQGEGNAWVLEVDDEDGRLRMLGNALLSAVRREMHQSTVAKLKSVDF